MNMSTHIHPRLYLNKKSTYEEQANLHLFLTKSSLPVYWYPVYNANIRVSLVDGDQTCWDQSPSLEVEPWKLHGDGLSSCRSARCRNQMRTCGNWNGRCNFLPLMWNITMYEVCSPKTKFLLCGHCMASSGVNEKDDSRWTVRVQRKLFTGFGPFVIAQPIAPSW